MELKIFLFLFCATLGSNVAYSQDCNNVIDDQCIFIDFANGNVDFDTAQENCESYRNDGTIARIKDMTTKELLLHITKLSSQYSRFWVDFRYCEGDLKYTDGKPVPTKFSFLSNATLFDFGLGKCTIVDIKSSDLAKITNCYEKYVGICQYPFPRCKMSEVNIPNAQFDKCNELVTVGHNINVSVKCDRGFILRGSPKIQCTSTGWSEIPKCVPGCLPPDFSDKVKIFNPKFQYEMGEKLLVYCDQGYLIGDKHLKSHQIVECMEGGNWPPLKNYCIAENELKCLKNVCSEKSITARPNTTVTLKCPLEEGNVSYSYFTWHKNHRAFKRTTETETGISADLVIPNFQVDSEGIYSCIRGQSASQIENVIIYDIKLLTTCPMRKVVTLPTVSVDEGDSIYLSSKDEKMLSEINWFKNDQLLFGKVERNILPNGDLLILNAKYDDRGLYSFHVKTAEENYCFDIYNTNVYVNAKAESICGQIEDEFNQPWIVALWSRDEVIPFCYGSLINEYWVVSSAFCLARFYRRKNNDVVVQFRNNNDDTSSNSYREIQVEQFIVHPQFSKRLNINDIGLLKLKEKVTFDRNVKPICLSPVDFKMEHDQLCEPNFQFFGLVSGWGSIEALIRDKIGNLRLENLTVATKDKCQNHMSFEFPDTMFCATNELDEDSLNFAGDSGSPFILRYNDRLYLHGIFSWGERSSQIGNYDYFTKIASYYEWINSNIKL